MPRPDLSHILPEQKMVVVAQYTKLASEDSAHYSPLQCAAYNDTKPETSPENARLGGAHFARILSWQISQ